MPEATAKHLRENGVAVRQTQPPRSVCCARRRVRSSPAIEKRARHPRGVYTTPTRTRGQCTNDGASRRCKGTGKHVYLRTLSLNNKL